MTSQQGPNSPKLYPDMFADCGYGQTLLIIKLHFPQLEPELRALARWACYSVTIPMPRKVEPREVLKRARAAAGDRAKRRAKLNGAKHEEQEKAWKSAYAKEYNAQHKRLSFFMRYGHWPAY